MENSYESQSVMQLSPIRSKLNTERRKHKMLKEAEKHRAKNPEYKHEFQKYSKRLKSSSLRDTFCKFSALFIHWKHLKQTRNLSSKKHELSNNNEIFSLNNSNIDKRMFKEKEESTLKEIRSNLKSEATFYQMKNSNAFKEIPNNIIPIFSTISISKCNKTSYNNETIPVILN